MGKSIKGMEKMIISWWWSWLLTAVGITGFWLSGSGKRVGWAVNMSAQGLWIAYSLQTEQYGFIIASVMYFIVFLRNWIRWGKTTPSTKAI